MSLVYLRPRLRIQAEQEKLPIREPKLFRKIRSLNRRGLNVITILSGDTGSGKSRFSGWMIETLDPGFLEDWENGFPRISISPLPFIRALRDNLLPKASWWFLDEPRDVKNIDWPTEVARAVRDVTTEMRVSVVNIAICTTLFKKLQNDLRDLAHYWVRMVDRENPGNCEVFKLETKRKYFKRLGGHMEVRTSRRLENLLHTPLPSERFERLYEPLRLNNFKDVTELHVQRLTKKGYIK